MKRVLIVAGIAIVIGIMGTIMTICWVFFSLWLQRNHHPSYEFTSTAVALQDARDYWLSHGRPADFQPGQFLGLADTFFVYTNAVRTTNSVLHCRFGSRRPGWPPGVLAVTDEGTVIFINETNGKVTISPDEKGVDP